MRHTTTPPTLTSGHSSSSASSSSTQRALIPAEVISHFLNVTHFIFPNSALSSVFIFPSSPHRLAHPERMFDTVHKKCQVGVRRTNTCFSEEDLRSFPGTITWRWQSTCATQVPRTKDDHISKTCVFFVFSFFLFACSPVLSLPSESTLGALHTQH